MCYYKNYLCITIILSLESEYYTNTLWVEQPSNTFTILERIEQRAFERKNISEIEINVEKKINYLNKT
jgi:hypothetical protein